MCSSYDLLAVDDTAKSATPADDKQEDRISTTPLDKNMTILVAPTDNDNNGSVSSVLSVGNTTHSVTATNDDKKGSVSSALVADDSIKLDTESRETNEHPDSTAINNTVISGRLPLQFRYT